MKIKNRSKQTVQVCFINRLPNTNPLYCVANVKPGADYSRTNYVTEAWVFRVNGVVEAALKVKAAKDFELEVQDAGFAFEGGSKQNTIMVTNPKENIPWVGKYQM